MLVKPESHSVAERVFLTDAQAKQAFKRQKATLLDVNGWKALSGAPNTFELYHDGQPSSHSRAYEGDFIRISAPGPFPAQWVKIVKIRLRHRSLKIVVRPSHDPTSDPIRPEVTTHIFRRRATNTFLITRTKNVIRASIRGRNEFTNTVEPEAGGGAWMNLVASVGLWLGFQKDLWDTFVARLVAINPKRLAAFEGGVRMNAINTETYGGHQAAISRTDRVEF
jgi:hypothetical protein